LQLPQSNPPNCVVNARAQVDVAPQPALHPPLDLSPALPASLGSSSHSVLTSECLDQIHTCLEQTRHYLQWTTYRCETSHAYRWQYPVLIAL
ncbi:hypothetical protein KCU69_g9, partial [Aureobasidium melanogenum]